MTGVRCNCVDAAANLKRVKRNCGFVFSKMLKQNTCKALENRATTAQQSRSNSPTGTGAIPSHILDQAGRKTLSHCAAAALLPAVTMTRVRVVHTTKSTTSAAAAGLDAAAVSCEIILSFVFRSDGRGTELLPLAVLAAPQASSTAATASMETTT